MSFSTLPLRRLMLVAVCLAAGRRVHAGSEPMIVVPLCDGTRMRIATDSLAVYESSRGRSTRLVPQNVSRAGECLGGLAAERAALLAEGRARFDKLEIPRAVDILSKLVASFDEHEVLDGDLEVLLTARAYLAWAALERKDEALARQHMRAACSLSQTFEPDANRFPPAVAAQAREICREPLASGALEVMNLPAPGRVIIDGNERCTTSCTVSVPVGMHYVSVVTPTYRRDVRIETVARETRTIDMSRDSTLAERVRYAIAAKDAATVGRELGDGGALVVVLDDAADGIRAWATEPPFLALYGPTVLVDASNDAAHARASVDAMLATMPNQPATTAVSRERSSPLWQKWWFWAGVGVIAAGTVATIAITAQDGNDDAHVRVNLP